MFPISIRKKNNPLAPEGASWPQNGFMIAGAAGVGPFLIHFRPGGGGGGATLFENLTDDAIALALCKEIFRPFPSYLTKRNVT